MAFGTLVKDQLGTPMAQVYVPGVGFVAISGSATTNTDGSSNTSTPANMNLAQIGSVATQMASADQVTSANVPYVAPGLFDGTNESRWGSIGNLGDGLQSARNVGGVGTWTFDGSGWNRTRGNQQGIGLISATGVTTTQTSSDQQNYNARGAIVCLNMTNVGTGSVTLSIRGREISTGTYFTILTGVAVTTNIFVVYRVYPGLTAVANATVSDMLPATWDVVVTANNANATTYTVNAMTML